MGERDAHPGHIKSDVPVRPLHDQRVRIDRVLPRERGQLGRTEALEKEGDQHGNGRQNITALAERHGQEEDIYGAVGLDNREESLCRRHLLCFGLLVIQCYIITICHF